MKTEVVIVTGTPGTGKTTFAKKLAKQKRFKYVDVNDVVKEFGLSEFYDRKRRTKVVDEKKLAKVLQKIIINFKNDKTAKEKGLVIDSHMSHFINPKYVDMCIVTKCGLMELEKRLKRKGYHKAKIEENIQSEIFDICYVEAVEMGHRVRVVESG